MDVAEVGRRLHEGDVRALSRAIRMVEDGDPAVADVLRISRSRTGKTLVVGITGPPGSGKSTLADLLVEKWRAQNLTVGVIAVDPSSPFSGGALLGDRVRMQRHSGDEGVFIRSMAARGHLGGLASATREAVRLIDASGKDRCLLETVGVGQSELEVMLTADTTIVVTTPTAGDSVQVIKAGILEIADIFVVNKADLLGAARVSRELKELVHETKGMDDWQPPVVQTNGKNGEGIDELVGEIERHLAYLKDSNQLQRRRLERLRAEVEAIVVTRAAQHARAALQSGQMGIDDSSNPNDIDPYALADQIWQASNKEKNGNG